MSAPVPTAGATGLAFPAAMTRVDYESVLQKVAAGTYAKPANHAGADDADNDDEDYVLERVPIQTQTFASSNRRKLLGVDFPTIVVAYLSSLTAAREAHNPADLIFDMTFAVVVGYTIARDFSEDYKKIGPMSMLRQFEIRERQRDTDPNIARKNAWVERSDMNSAALHLLGYLIVDAAPEGSFLRKIRDTKGTPFNPVQGEKEQQKLIQQAAKELTAEDRTAMNHFKEASPTLINVVSKLFGQAGASLTAARTAADSLKEMEF